LRAEQRVDADRQQLMAGADDPSWTCARSSTAGIVL